jgi:hypothetical protein
MMLLYDEYADCWVWVEINNHDIELSLHFDTEGDARLWRVRMINLLKGKV